MKKVMFVVFSLLLVGSCFAQLQSGPSNTVGYVKVDIAAGNPVYKEFGLPFKFWDVPANNIPTYGVESRRPSDIVGTQANCGNVGSADRIHRQDTGTFAYRNGTSPCTAAPWTGSLETSAVNMDPMRAYWYINKSNAARTLVLAGQVENGSTNAVAVSAPTVPNTSTYTPLSFKDARDVPNNQLGLVTDGFLGGTIGTSDRLIAQTGGAFAWFRTSDNTWQGTLTVVNPGRAYWIQNKHLNHTWTYIYEANGTPISDPNGGTHDIQVISAPSTKQAAKTATAN